MTCEGTFGGRQHTSSRTWAFAGNEEVEIFVGSGPRCPLSVIFLQRSQLGAAVRTDGSDRGLCSLSHFCCQTRAVLPGSWLQRKTLLGAKGCWVQLSPCGCWVPCRGQGQQEKHLLFRWLQGLKSRGSSQTQRGAFTRQQFRAELGLLLPAPSVFPLCVQKKGKWHRFPLPSPPQVSNSPTAYSGVAATDCSWRCLLLAAPLLASCHDTEQCQPQLEHSGVPQLWLYQPLLRAHTSRDPEGAEGRDAGYGNKTQPHMVTATHPGAPGVPGVG